jgi:hypothetical protein
MRRTSKKTRRSRTNRPTHTNRSSARKNTSHTTLASKIRATRTWIIAAIVAGLGLSITGAVVSLTNVTAGWFGGVIGISHNNTTLKTTDINTTAIGPLLNIQVTQGFNSDPCGGGGNGWVFPKSASAVIATSPAKGPTRGGQTWVSDPSAWGAVQASDVVVQMVASGNSQRAIVLTGLKVRILRRRPALQGTLVDTQPYPPTACGAAVFQAGTVNLDTSPPTWIPETSTGPAAAARTAPVKFPYEVSVSDPEPFIFTITTQRCDCTWTLELDWVAGSTNGKNLITDNGKPFETTAAGNLPYIEWGYGPSDGPWRRIR